MQALVDKLAVVNFELQRKERKERGAKKYLLTDEKVAALFETLAEVNFQMVMGTLSHTLAKTQFQTLRDKKARRIENLQSYRRSPQTNSLVDTQADSVAEVNVKTLKTNCSTCKERR